MGQFLQNSQRICVQKSNLRVWVVLYFQEVWTLWGFRNEGQNVHFWGLFFPDSFLFLESSNVAASWRKKRDFILFGFDLESDFAVFQFSFFFGTYFNSNFFWLNFTRENIISFTMLEIHFTVFQANGAAKGDLGVGVEVGFEIVLREVEPDFGNIIEMNGFVRTGCKIEGKFSFGFCMNFLLDCGIDKGGNTSKGLCHNYNNLWLEPAQSSF